MSIYKYKIYTFFLQLKCLLNKVDVFLLLQEHENPGYLMISLAYDKESEKLTVIVLRGKLLKCAAHEDTLLQETISKIVKSFSYS